MIQTTLYFGRDYPEGQVSNSQWNRFVDEVLGWYFGEGYTVLDGQGGWRSPATGKQVREKCKIVILLRADSEAKELAVEAVRDAYRARFDQESVMRVDQPVTVKF